MGPGNPRTICSLTATALSGSGSRALALNSTEAPVAGCVSRRPSSGPTARAPFDPAVREGNRSVIDACTSESAASPWSLLWEVSCPSAAVAYFVALDSWPGAECLVERVVHLNQQQILPISLGEQRLGVHR